MEGRLGRTGGRGRRVLRRIRTHVRFCTDLTSSLGGTTTRRSFRRIGSLMISGLSIGTSSGRSRSTVVMSFGTPRTPRIRVSRVSGGLLGRVQRVVRRGVISSSFGISVLRRGVNVKGGRLCHGLGTVANRAPMRCVHSVEVRGTTGLLGTNGFDISRMVCAMNFSGDDCFSGYFSGTFKVAPARFVHD